MKNRYLKLFLTLIYDMIVADASLMVSFLMLNKQYIYDNITFLIYSLIALPVILVINFYLFHIYNVMWRFSRYGELARIGFATVIAGSVLFITQMAVFNKAFSLSIYVVVFMMISILISSERLLEKKYYINIEEAKVTKAKSDLSGNIMIIGGGSAGSAIINEIIESAHLKSCSVKCVIDDDISKKGLYICGIKIVGGREEILESVKKYDISTIIFAIASCSSADKADILNTCQKTSCELRTVPAIYQLLDKKLEASSIRKVEIEDLLGRDPICINLKSVMKYVENKVVMITGGGGSIGSELCRQIAAHNPKQLIIFDVYENNAYDIQNELKKKYPDLELITLIGSVRDSKRLDCIFEKYYPQIVYHAAAHKHVPLMEDSPNETIKNNVFGTYKTVKCADKYGVEKFVLISTDKAVNPTNIMGASKRICEMIIQTFNSHSDTEFVAVRFGNVLGSNGSVIPLFKKQILQGGPVTVTDPNIIRYFMTIPEAVSLVLQAGASAKGGEIFVLDMGQPVKILTLAENLIRLSGLTPYVDIKIEFTGLRAGEKLYEELLMSEEGMQDTDNSLIHIGNPISFDEDLFFEVLSEMYAIMYDDSVNIKPLVKKIVPTYNYKENSVMNS